LLEGAEQILPRLVVVAVEAEQHVGVEHHHPGPHDLLVLAGLRRPIGSKIGVYAAHDRATLSRARPPPQDRRTSTPDQQNASTWQSSPEQPLTHSPHSLELHCTQVPSQAGPNSPVRSQYGTQVPGCEMS